MSSMTRSVRVWRQQFQCRLSVPPWSLKLWLSLQPLTCLITESVKLPCTGLCDSVSGANWRPTRFEDELTLSRYACCLCHVVPSTTAVLPCSHALCEQCLTGCAVEDAGKRLSPGRRAFQRRRVPEVAASREEEAESASKCRWSGAVLRKRFGFRRARFANTRLGDAIAAPPPRPGGNDVTKSRVGETSASETES
ncbi:hypothetical protein MTO96_043844 [Rhipicephalus appendiculatus]